MSNDSGSLHVDIWSIILKNLSIEDIAHRVSLLSKRLHKCCRQHLLRLLGNREYIKKWTLGPLIWTLKSESPDQILIFEASKFRSILGPFESASFLLLQVNFFDNNVRLGVEDRIRENVDFKMSFDDIGLIHTKNIKDQVINISLLKLTFPRCLAYKFCIENDPKRKVTVTRLHDNFDEVIVIPSYRKNFFEQDYFVSKEQKNSSTTELFSLNKNDQKVLAAALRFHEKTRSPTCTFKENKGHLQLLSEIETNLNIKVKSIEFALDLKRIIKILSCMIVLKAGTLEFISDNKFILLKFGSLTAKIGKSQMVQTTVSSPSANLLYTPPKSFDAYDENSEEDVD